jgi:hypothetical protein
MTARDWIDFLGGLAGLMVPMVFVLAAQKALGESVLGFRAFVWPFVFIGYLFWVVLVWLWHSMRAARAGLGYAARRTSALLEPDQRPSSK